MSQTLHYTHEFPPSNGKDYAEIPFAVAPNTEYIRFSSRVIAGNGSGIDIGLADNNGDIRGWSNELTKPILLGAEQATLGYLAGPLEAGNWKILLGENLKHSKTIQIEICIELLPCTPRIVRGDIHGHSLYSDGAHSIETKLQMAKDAGLDFLGFTDHNSVAQNFCLPTDSEVLLLPSCEITTYNGHVNVFGYHKRKIPNFMCRSSEELRQVLCELKEHNDVYLQLNHPIRRSDVAGCQWNWNYDMPFDWIEIWNGNWNADNDENLNLWQSFLESGRFLGAVGNSDFHRKGSKRQGYSCNNVWVPNKTAKEIYAALARGRNYITAQPLPHENFAIQCGFAGSEIPFGSTLTTNTGRANTEKPELLEVSLTTARAFLNKIPGLSLRIWNHEGLYVEQELRAEQFKEWPVKMPHDCRFLLPLNLNEGCLHSKTTGLRFVRFELWETPKKRPLLLSNPIFLG